MTQFAHNRTSFDRSNKTLALILNHQHLFSPLDPVVILPPIDPLFIFLNKFNIYGTYPYIISKYLWSLTVNTKLQLWKSFSTRGSLSTSIFSPSNLF
ncbi:heat shock 70 kDa protein 16-like [Iris pallida]|uniref:Heat shock 70 kDa protein 16-like n=1 Tax=Iris pallida TaxID=29817 RepID=A0AAX6FHH4_IRIPA|nr:heat shock 70 kDa protein 16-like [Iris pallida]